MVEKATVVNEPVAMQSSESSSCSGLSWNQKRSQARLESSFNSWIKVSLQKCDISDNINKLQGHIAMTNSKKKRQAIFGLIVVFEELSFNGGFLSFEEAYELYLAHQNTNTDRDLFRDKLLDSEIGLCIVYFIHPVTKTSYIAFKSKYIKTEYFLSNFIKSTEKEDEKLPTFLSDKELLKLALSLMDSEFDKQLLKLAVISAQPSLNAIMNMGIDKSTAVNLANNVGIVLEEYQNCLIAASDMVKLRLRQKVESDFNAKK